MSIITTLPHIYTKFIFRGAHTAQYTFVCNYFWFPSPSMVIRSMAEMRNRYWIILRPQVLSICQLSPLYRTYTQNSSFVVPIQHNIHLYVIISDSPAPPWLFEAWLKCATDIGSYLGHKCCRYVNYHHFTAHIHKIHLSWCPYSTIYICM